MTIEDMQARAAIKGGKCLSKEYINKMTPLLWRCAKGHTWETNPAIIIQGGWCPSCAKNTKHTIEEMQQIAEARGGKCLSEKYTNSFAKLKWQCAKGHIWESATVMRGTWCPYCAKNIKRTIEEMQQIAEARRGKCLSEKYINSQAKLKWQCAKGHIWESANIRKGTWCPYCFGNKRHNIGEMRQIAKSRGGKCLSKEYVNQTTKLKWKCKEGHIWSTKPDNIKRGTWCPRCAKTIKYTIEEMQQIAEARGGKCLSEKYTDNKTKLKWQCAKGHIWESAIVIKGSWCPYCYGHIKFGIDKMKQIAKSKGGKCLSKEYVNQKTKLRWKCKEGHIWNAKPITLKIGTWCPYCAKTIKRTIEEMQQIAEARGGKCLSEKYTNNKTKLKWQCAKGHIWESVTVMKGGTWCPYCYGNIKLSIDEMKSIAKSKGGKCLSKEYVNVNTKLRWKCKKGHIWSAIPKSVKKGTWCPVCALKKLGHNNEKYTLEEMQQIAEARGGRCLSDTYINSETYLSWQCKRGHIWSAIPYSVKHGSWCRKCYCIDRKQRRCVNINKN
ncbi:MAG: hypothetical protein A2X08_03720 [Bacteroidetes bacterium GWA2_32_17]|nr:MAG: hypothetical protein A2X08_03720 [Bacteroidetes bacterium GWA2_32_17]